MLPTSLNTYWCFLQLSYGKTTWGAVSSSLRRIVPAAYADGRDVPRGGWTPDFQPGCTCKVSLFYFCSLCVLFFNQLQGTHQATRALGIQQPPCQMQGRSALSSTPIPQMRITLWVKTIDRRAETWIIEIHTCSSFFTGHPHGNAIWPICWSWPNFDPREECYWLLHWGSAEWSVCTWLLPHSLWRLGPNICQPGKK